MQFGQEVLVEKSGSKFTCSRMLPFVTKEGTVGDEDGDLVGLEGLGVEEDEALPLAEVVVGRG